MKQVQCFQNRIIIVAPQISEDILMQNVRNPLLAKVDPVSIQSGYDEGFLLITGANMVKTLFLFDLMMIEWQVDFV